METKQRLKRHTSQPTGTFFRLISLQVIFIYKKEYRSVFAHPDKSKPMVEGNAYNNTAQTINSVVLSELNQLKGGVCWFNFEL